MDYNNLIQHFKESFTTSNFWGRNQVSFTTMLFKKHILNRWQQ